MLLLGGNSFYPLDWMVYDDRTVLVASPGSYGTVWNFRRDEGSSPDSSGPDANERPNAVRVAWDDGTGATKTAAPNNILADFTDNSLRIDDPTHPANVAGLNRYKTLNVGVSTQAAATLLGQVYLADKNRQEWRGTVMVQGSRGLVRDGSQLEFPVYMVRAGDRAVLGDDGDTRERRIVGTSYDSESRKVSVDIGPKPGYFDTLLARAGVVLGTGVTGVTPKPASDFSGPGLMFNSTSSEDFF
jgi:hypothetical protein